MSYPLHKTEPKRWKHPPQLEEGHPATAQPNRDAPAQLHKGNIAGQLGPCCHCPRVSQAAGPVCTTHVWVQSPRTLSTWSCEMPCATPMASMVLGAWGELTSTGSSTEASTQHRGLKGKSSPSPQAHGYPKPWVRATEGQVEGPILSPQAIFNPQTTA